MPPVVGAGTPVHPSLAVITPENITQLAELARWGRGVINDVAYSTDGTWIAVGTSRGIYVHDVHDFQTEPRHIEIIGGASTVAISPDGELVAAALLTGQVQIWHVADSILLYTVPVHAYSLQFSPDGRFLATDRDVWWVNSGELYFASPNERAFATIFSPLSETIAIWSYGSLTLYQTSDLTLMAEFESDILSQGEQSLQTGVFADIWFTSETEFITLIPQVDPNGTTGLIEVQQGNTNELLFVVEGIKRQANPVPTFCDEPVYFADPPGSPQTWQVEVSITEQIVAFLYNDTSYKDDPRTYNSVRLHRLSDGELLYIVTGGIKTMAFAPDGRTWVTATQDGQLQIRQVQDGEVLESYGGYSAPVLDIVVSSDAQTVAIEYLDKVVLHRLNDGAVLFTYPATQAAFVPNQEIFALGYSDGRIELRTIQDGTLNHILTGHTEPIIGLTSTFTGEMLISSGLDCVINRWQMPDGSFVGPLEPVLSDQNVHQSSLPLIVRGVVPVPNQDWLMGRFGFGIALWQVQNGTLLRLFVSLNYLDELFFSPDGRYLATPGEATLLWHFTPQQELNEYMADESRTSTGAFSLDGELLAAASAGYFSDPFRNGALMVWSVATQELLLTLTPVTDNVTAMAFTPDGRFLLSGSIDGVVRLWGVP
jgi:WD40 repeat protein